MQKNFDNITVFLLLSTIVILAMAAFIITILFIYRKKQIAYFKEVKQIKTDHEKDILTTQLEMQEQTFQAVSRDIHDNISLTLTLAKLNLNTLNLADKEKTSVQVKASVDFVSRAIIDLTDMSRSINSDIIVEEGLISALRLEVERLRRLDMFSVQFEVTGESIFLDVQKELFIYRIIQEAFNNILKHAAAKTVKLYVYYGADKIVVVVMDDGVGFTSALLKEKRMNKPSAGFRNMQKRTELMNGSWQIESEEGVGTTITISIPFNYNDNNA